MNRNDFSYWDAAQLRIAASRERAKALRELRARFAAWLRAALSTHARRTEAPCA